MKTLLTCTAVAVAALALSACGGNGAATAENAVTAQPGQQAERAVAGQGPCPAGVMAFVDSLDRLRRRLAIGLSYEQYAAEVKALAASYGRLPIDRLALACLATTGTPAERAFDKYVDATNAWGACLADASCATATIEPVLQRKWRVASGFLGEAR